MAMAVPGCPEFTAWTASMANVRIVLIQRSSICVSVAMQVPPFLPDLGLESLARHTHVGPGLLYYHIHNQQYHSDFHSSSTPRNEKGCKGISQRDWAGEWLQRHVVSRDAAATRGYSQNDK